MASKRLFGVGGEPVAYVFAAGALTRPTPGSYSDSEDDSGDDEIDGSSAPAPAAATTATAAMVAPVAPTAEAPSFEDAKAQLKQNCKAIKLMFSEKLLGLTQMLNDATLGPKVSSVWNKGEEHMLDIISFVNQIMQLCAAGATGSSNKKLLDAIRTLRKKSASPAFLDSLEQEIQDKRKELKQLQTQKRELDEENKKLTVKKDYASQRQKKRAQLEQLEQSIAKDFDYGPIKLQTEANLREIKQAELEAKEQEDRLTQQLAKLPKLAVLKKELADGRLELQRLKREVEEWERKSSEMNAKAKRYDEDDGEDQLLGGVGGGKVRDECPVCFDELNVSNRARFTPCMHDICTACFACEAKTPPPFMYALCPYCRTPVEQITADQFQCRVTRAGAVAVLKGKLPA